MEQDPQTIESVRAKQKHQTKHKVERDVLDAKTSHQILESQMGNHENRQHRNVVSEEPVLAIAIVDLSTKQPSVTQDPLVSVVVRVGFVAGFHRGLDHQWNDNQEGHRVKLELELTHLLIPLFSKKSLASLILVARNGDPPLSGWFSSMILLWFSFNLALDKVLSFRSSILKASLAFIFGSNPPL
ncbi:hypothetical protein OGAPHI_003072 [Ogataea philodendri]|uniref:Uncharacterized protein n=1 Tax=Ogataea philodendri TaxID=1378263 RepID=A0A9P8P8B7_9ASCO|nr:uncharacterized protein OGAPHI_003072 [Ogataea philodendri]KAH3667423.1 hypothetical protein OGAPHI_003072 [Ogataea philodendri]